MLSVLLPATGDSPGLEKALASLRAQTRPPAEILLILNAPAPGLVPRAKRLAADDASIRVLLLPRANLAAALNEGLREARHPRVARQDADDESLPDRFARQLAYLERSPASAGVGTAFERVTPEGRLLAVVRPPTEPAEIRWRLLLDNAFCHGSMLLERAAVLEAGAYDEALPRAQDYDLWLRLSRLRDLANLPDVLYRYAVASPELEGIAGEEQARHATTSLLRAWRDLPRSGMRDDARAAFELAWRDPRLAPAGVRAIENALTRDGATVETLLALLHATRRIGVTPTRSHLAARRARLREIGARLRTLAPGGVHLWGAGTHTAWILDHARDLGLPVLGIVDEARAGEPAHAFTIAPASSLRTGAHVLLSSDWHEDSLWEASAGARERGVIVHRFYGDGA